MINTTEETVPVPLGTVARFIRGITFKPDELINGDDDDAVACMRTKNVQADLDQSDLLFVPSHLVRREEQLIQSKDMLVSTANSWELVGKTSWVPDLDYRATAGGFISILRANTEKVWPRYLYHWFTSSRVQESVRNCGRKTTNISNLNYALCLSIEIPLPAPNDPARSLAKQKRIADILDKADAIVCKQREAVAIADSLIASQFRFQFGDPVINSQQRSLVPLSAYGRITTGNTPSRKDADNYGDAIEWIKSDNINTPRHWLTESTERLSDIGRSIARTVPAGSTLVTCIAGSPACVGNAAMTNRTVAFNQQINAITPLESVDPLFLYALVLLSKPLVQRASTESMKGMVSKGKFEQVQVIEVAPADQTAFGQTFQKILGLLDRQDEAARTANECFNSLVQRAFRGEL